MTGDRTITIRGMIDGPTADLVAAQLLGYADTGPEPITLEIESPGGAIDAAFAVIDTMAYVDAPVATRASGRVAGTAALIVACGTKALRSAAFDTRFTLRPSIEPEPGTTGATGDAAVAKVAAIIDRFILEHSTISEAQLNDPELAAAISAERALALGLIDRID